MNNKLNAAYCGSSDSRERIHHARWMAQWAALLVVPVLAGCALVSPTDPYQPVSSSAPSATPGATARAAHGNIDLAQAIDIALANNPDVAAVRQDSVAAQARYRQAVGAALPSLHAVGSYNRFLDDQRLVQPHFNGELGVFGPDVVNGDLVLTMPLFTSGRIINEIRAAKLLQQAATHQLARSREELVFNVASVFNGILATRHVVESLVFSEKTLADHLKRVEDLLAAQRAVRNDRLRVEVRLADIRQTLVQARSIEAIQVRTLASLLGLTGSATDWTVSGDLPVPVAANAVPLEETVADALRQRPDYLAARSALEAQAKVVDAARAGHWPTVSLLADYGGRWTTDPAQQPAGANNPEDVGFAGVVVDVPIFEGGRIAARVTEQRAKLAAAQARLQKLELQVRLDVETALLNIAAARERVLATQKAIAQAEESLTIERDKYNGGKGTILDVLDAQSALLESQTSYYQALAAFNTAQAQLSFAKGETR